MIGCFHQRYLPCRQDDLNVSLIQEDWGVTGVTVWMINKILGIENVGATDVLRCSQDRADMNDLPRLALDLHYPNLPGCFSGCTLP
jgi:hypothetical protein